MRLFTRAVRRVVAVVLSTALAGALAGCGGGEEAPDVTIGVGGQKLLIYLPTTLAHQLGYYREEGLDVRIEELQSGSKALQALQGGSVDVVSGFYDHTIQMRAKGRDVRAFVNMLRYPSLVLTVSPKARKRIRSVRDLAGTTVGVTSPGSSSDFFVKYLLARQGLSPTAAAVQAVGTDARAVAAMESGTVDAAVMIDPALSVLRQRLGGRELTVLADTRTVTGVQESYGVATYPASVLYSTGRWIDTRQDTARRMARAITRTLEWIQQHSAKEIADRMPPQFLGENPELYVEALEHARTAFSPDGLIQLEGAQAVHKVLRQFNPEIGRSSLDLTKTFTNDFATAR